MWIAIPAIAAMIMDNIIRVVFSCILFFIFVSSSSRSVAYDDFSIDVKLLR